MSLVWKLPWLPVIPWTIARVCFPIKTAIYAGTLLTASLAASSILSIAVSPADWSIFLPSSWLVPTIRMTSGFLRPMTFFTSTIPFATSSHLVIPASMLTNTARTFSAPWMIWSAVATCSALAPPEFRIIDYRQPIKIGEKVGEGALLGALVSELQRDEPGVVASHSEDGVEPMSEHLLGGLAGGIFNVDTTLVGGEHGLASVRSI